MNKKINSTQKTFRARGARSDKAVKIKTENNGFGLIKSLIVLLVVLLQIVFFILPSFYFVRGLSWYIVFSSIMSLVTCVYILSSNRNSNSKAVWILFLMAFSSFGYLIFILSDERIFFRKQKKRYKEIYEKSYNFQAEPTGRKDVIPEVQKSIKLLNSEGNFVDYSRTKLQYHSSGAAAMDDILDAIKNAKSFIFIEYFIISDGILLKRFLNILSEKASQGVEIRMIYDDMGCHKTLSRKTKIKMMDAGIKLSSFNQLISILSVGLNYRDHRKIVVVDGKVAFTGGINLADEYINEKRMHGFWKDSAIKIQGPAVDGLTLCFLRQWEFIRKEKTEYSKFLNHAEDFNSNSVVVPFSDGLDYNNNIARDFFINFISNAKTRLFIMTPYFVPDDLILNLIKTKAMSGVDVRIIIPSVPDKKIVYAVTRANVESLIKYNVKVYCMNLAFVHSKLLLSENGAIVGSINFDLRSFYQQFENAIYTNDSRVMKDIQADFSKTIEKSTMITTKNAKTQKLYYKLWSGFLRLISPLM